MKQLAKAGIRPDMTEAAIETALMALPDRWARIKMIRIMRDERSGWLNARRRANAEGRIK